MRLIEYQPVAAPAVARALRDEEAQRVFEGLPLPTVILAADRRVLMQNAAARALPNALACFTMSYGRVTHFAAASTEPFERVFVRALNGIVTSAVVTLASDARQCLWRVTMGAVMRGEAHSDAAVVMVIDPPPVPGGSLTALQRLFGLTPAEARVLALLLDDCRPREIAEELNLSITTVRSHLKALFSKTGTRRQSELVALAWSAV